MPYAGFWLRAGAIVIDTVILSVGIFVVVFGLMFCLMLIGGVDEKAVERAIQVLNLILAIAYYAGFESSKLQATPGKLMLKLKVTGLDGGRITPTRAAFRYLGRVLCLLTLGIGYFMAGFTARKQGLHDMVAGCLVVRVMPVASGVSDAPAVEAVAQPAQLSLDKS